MKQPILLPLAVAIFAIINFSATTQAEQQEPSYGEPFTIQELTEQADFVFQGTVTKIEYANSTSTDGSSPAPYTFVTYNVTDVISGTYTEPTITLRFEGGINAAAGVMTIGDHLPTFDIGDTDILFVAGNGESYCPLVGCDEGRLRVVGNELQDEEGYQVVAQNIAAKLKKGKRKPSDLVDKFNVGNSLFTKHYSTDDPSQATMTYPPNVSVTDLKKKAKTFKAKSSKGKKMALVNPHTPFTVNLLSSIGGANATEQPQQNLNTTPTNEIPISPDELALIKQQEVETHANDVQAFTNEIPELAQ